MGNKMRIVGWQIQPVVMADNGVDLTPLDIKAQFIPSNQWQAFKDGGDVQAVEQIRDQVEGGAEPRADVTATQ